MANLEPYHELLEFERKADEYAQLAVDYLRDGFTEASIASSNLAIYYWMRSQEELA